MESFNHGGHGEDRLTVEGMEVCSRTDHGVVMSCAHPAS